MRFKKKNLNLCKLFFFLPILPSTYACKFQRYARTYHYSKNINIKKKKDIFPENIFPTRKEKNICKLFFFLSIILIIICSSFCCCYSYKSYDVGRDLLWPHHFQIVKVVFLRRRCFGSRIL